MQLPVEDIHPSPYQARTTFDEQELAGLAQSIRENGLLQPITVRKTDSGYELVAGERRLRACSWRRWEPFHPSSAISPTSAPPRLACSKICSGQT